MEAPLSAREGTARCHPGVGSAAAEYNLRSMPGEARRTYTDAMSLPRRPDPVDVLVVALVVGQQLALWRAESWSPSVSLVLLHVMAPGALLARRRAPLAATLVTLASEAALIQLMPSTLSVWFFSTIVAMAVIGSLRLPIAITGLVAMLGVCVEGGYLDRYGGGAGDLVMSFAIMAGAWTTGLLLGRRAAAARELASRSADLERARDRAADEAVAAERARVTRELHDVVAHGLTVLVIQLVAARDAIDHGEPPEQVVGRLRNTEEVAREALSELRVLLGILGEHDARPVAAATGADGVRDLVAQFRTIGQAVTLHVHGAERSLGAGVAMAVYRVVQEGLTNVLKHADGAPTNVTVRFGRGAVEVQVENAPGLPGRLTGDGAGRGLAGLAERVHLHGGELSSGPTPEGGFVVRCTIPDRSPGGVSVEPLPDAAGEPVP